jgi:hypothetical protein
MGRLTLLYIGGDVVRPDRRERQAASVAPGEEPAARPRIGAPRVGVADVGGEEFDIAPAGGITGSGDQRRDQGDGVSRDRDRGKRDDGRELGGRVETFGLIGLAHVHGLYHASHA